MTNTLNKTIKSIDDMTKKGSVEELVEKTRPKYPLDKPLPDAVPNELNWSKKAAEERQVYVSSVTGKDFKNLKTFGSIDNYENLRGNIENFIGMSQIPTGIIGPLRVNGLEANGDFFVPMATSEGALIASYNRGAKIVSQAGGASSACLLEAVQRAPSFIFRNFPECGEFIVWCSAQAKKFAEITKIHTSHGKLNDIRFNVTGNQIAVLLEFQTGDAAGQNMVTICSEAICNYINENSPVKPLNWYIEGNLSGDKKATSLSLTSVRGKKVTAEVTIKKELVADILRTTPEAIVRYWQTSVINGIQSGSIGVNGHFANALTAVFIACGQDAACVAEAAVGINVFQLTEENDLYVSVTLPNMIVGTVGGGTSLPTQRECLEIMDCYGEGKSKKFAEICAALVLCGEISIAASIAAGSFSKAHRLFGRRKKKD